MDDVAIHLVYKMNALKEINEKGIKHSKHKNY